MDISSLMLTLIASSFFIIGFIISIMLKKQSWLKDITLGMVFTVLLLIAVLGLNTEAIHRFNTYFDNHLISLILLISSIIFGMIILRVLDIFIPHHNHEEEKATPDNHLFHVGIMTSISLILHNIIHGMALYGLGLADYKSGLMFAIAIGIHNIPFGINLGMLFENKRANKLSVLLLLFGLIISTTLGGTIIGLFGNLNNIVMGLLLGITLGIIVYILIFELYGKIKAKEKKNNLYIGMLIGVILMLISKLL